MSATTPVRAPGGGVGVAWPRDPAPLRVAIIGWARLALQALQGSGYNVSASELAAGLVMSGHQVFYLSSGRRYDLLPRTRVREVERWRGVRCYDLLNAPNLSPAVYNFRNMRPEVASPRTTSRVLRWLDHVRADVVHVHSLEGFGVDLVPAIARTGRAVVVTPHNYWFVCPQVDLMHDQLEVCLDYEGGRRCVGCIDFGPAWATRWKRRLGQTIEGIAGMKVAGAVRQGVEALGDRVRDLRAGRRDPIPNNRPPDPDTALGFDVPPGVDPSHDGRVQHNFRPDPDEPPMGTVAVSPLDLNERLLGDVPGGPTRDVHLVVVNEYGRRRRAGVDALNHADLVIPPSDFVRRVHVLMGVEEKRTRVVRLGQPHFDQLNRRARRSPFYDVRPWSPATSTGPLRLGYFSTTRPSKGLGVLLDAIERLHRDVRQRCQFVIRASGEDWELRKRMSPYPEVNFLGGFDYLQLLGAWGEYDVAIVPHAWLENSPLVLLEQLHAGKMVVASRLGGPPEWIVEPAGDGSAAHNGVMFPGGDPDALAACVGRLVRGEVVIPSPREIHRATPNLQSYPGHVQTVAAVYREVLAARAAGMQRAVATAAAVGG